LGVGGEEIDPDVTLQYHAPSLPHPQRSRHGTRLRLWPQRALLQRRRLQQHWLVPVCERLLRLAMRSSAVCGEDLLLAHPTVVEFCSSPSILSSFHPATSLPSQALLPLLFGGSCSRALSPSSLPPFLPSPSPNPLLLLNLSCRHVFFCLSLQLRVLSHMFLFLESLSLPDQWRAS
jgi:hypothetical protein